MIDNIQSMENETLFLTFLLHTGSRCVEYFREHAMYNY